VDLRELLGLARCRRRLAVGAVATLALAALAVVFLPGTVADSAEKLAGADRRWLLLALAGFLASAVSSAGIWHEGMAAAGRRASLADACARYGVGSLVNSFTPGRLGELARVALFSQTVPEEGRGWATGGGVAAIVAARAVAMAVALCAAAAFGAVPVWVVGTLLAIGAAGFVAAVAARHRVQSSRLERLLAPFRALGNDPKRSARLVAWALAAAAARVVALAATAAAVGVPSAFVVALILLPALDLASVIVVTPGNVGISSGMTAVALASHGVALPLGLTAGLAIHAAETAVGICFGLVGTLALAPVPPPVRTRLALSATAAISAAAFLAIALTLRPDLV